MASLNDICEAIASTIQNNAELPVATYATPADMKVFPAVMVEPDEGNFAVSMSAETEYTVRIYVLCSTAGSTSAALQQLNSLLDGWGPNSIRQIIFEHRDLGLPSTVAFVRSLGGYSGAFESVGLNAVGAYLTATVTTDSRQQSAP